jgi:Holliday junction resolvase
MASRANNYQSLGQRMTINSRNKGASFEREIAQMLEAELGFSLSVICVSTKQPTMAI